MTTKTNEEYKSWKTINPVSYDPKVEGSFKYLGKNFKHRKEIKQQGDEIQWYKKEY